MIRKRVRKKTTQPRRFCEHCQTDVAHATYFIHRRKFLDVNRTSGVEVQPQVQQHNGDSEEEGNEHDDYMGEITSHDNNVTETPEAGSSLSGAPSTEQKINDIVKKARTIYISYTDLTEKTNNDQKKAQELLEQALLNLDEIICISNVEKRKRKEAVWSVQDYLSAVDEEISNEDSSSDDLGSKDGISDADTTDTETDSSDDDNEFECWNESDLENFRKEMLNTSQQPFIQRKPSQLTMVQKSLMYMLYFILLWKAVNIVSNNALETILTFLPHAITAIDPTNQSIISFVAIFPTTVYAAWKFFGIDRSDFEKYIVCPKCTAIYKKEDIIIMERNRNVAKVCMNIPFSAARFQRVCGTPLVRQVRLKNGEVDFVPIKTYPYKSIIDSLEALLSRSGIEEECEKWRSRTSALGEYTDIYDGSIWDKYLTYDGKDFLKAANTHGIMINVDWFQPFERRKDLSIGVIYAVLMNLPRQLRFRRENVLLIGIIPALSKEPESLNSFLMPFVNEMKVLLTGVRMKTFMHSDSVMVRCAVLCASADIPAIRKLCGFLGHSAHRACSKCFKMFPGGFGEKKDFSGFDKQRWPKRSNLAHRRAVNEIKACTTKTSRKKKESQLGCRYSVLLELPYFNVVTQHVIDPMHNLFLGTAKHIFKIWIEKEILNKERLEKVEDRIKLVSIPHEYGRLPNNISSNWGGFTADQWKNWTLVYSLFVLKGILPMEHYKIWHTFTQACRILIRPTVSTSGLKIADHLFLKFCREVEQLYGRHVITCNMHLHCHLTESIQNFGSVFGFWLFSFERYNGMLSNLNTNKRDIEVQLMREFTSTDKLFRLFYELPTEGFEKLSSLINTFLFKKGDFICSENEIRKLHKISTAPLNNISDVTYWTTGSSSIIKSDLYVTKFLTAFDKDNISFLLKSYNIMYPNFDISEKDLAITCCVFDSITIAGEYFSSKKDYRGKKMANILASWADDGNGSINPSGIRPGLVKYYIQHNVRISGQYKTHVFAIVKWYREGESVFLNPVSSWRSKSFEPTGASSYLPIQRIYGKIASFSTNDNALHVIPLYRRIKM